MITRLYRKYIPAPIRDYIYDLFLNQLLMNVRGFRMWAKSVSIYLFSPFFPKDEYYNAYRFMGKYGLTMYPGPYYLRYKSYNTAVSRDEEEGGLLYVVHQNKRLYFPRRYTPSDANKYYRSLLIEQDPECAHCYVKSYDELKGKTLLDIGAAEGIFALDAIEKLDYVYLFECEEKWMEALRVTFRPWKEKICIVKKYVSDHDEGECLTIDSLFQDKEKNNIFIKMDIEGAELAALKGAGQLLKNGKQISLAICTYHHPQDVHEIPSYLESLGYDCSLTKGFLFMGNGVYRGVCRANK